MSRYLVLPFCDVINSENNFADANTLMQIDLSYFQLGTTSWGCLSSKKLKLLRGKGVFFYCYIQGWVLPISGITERNGAGALLPNKRSWASIATKHLKSLIGSKCSGAYHPRYTKPLVNSNLSLNGCHGYRATMGTVTMATAFQLNIVLIWILAKAVN